MASAGRKDEKNVSDTPESSSTESSTTHSSTPSVDDEAALLHRRSAGESSSGRQSRSRVKKKKDTSESSTSQSSGPSVHHAEAHPPPSSEEPLFAKCSLKKTAPSDSPTTQSSVVSVSTDDPHLISLSSQASSIKSRQGKPAPSESSTQSSMPSVDNEEAHLLPCTSSSRSPRKTDTAAAKRSYFASSSPPSTRNPQKRSPEKSGLAVPEPKSSGSSPKSPSKSPSTLSRMAKSIKDAFTPSKSPKGSTRSRSRSRSASHRKTYPEFESAKVSDESKEPASNSEMIPRENLENVQPSSSSNSGGRVRPDDASQAEMEGRHHKVPQTKKGGSSQIKGMISRVKMTLAPHDGKVDKSSSDASPKSSSKSATSSSSVSPVSRQRQESDASNLSWENSRTSNSKSSSTSCANDGEYLLPQMASQFLRCSPNKSRGDSREGSSSDSAACRPRPGTEEFERSMLFTHIDDPCPSEPQEHNFGTEPVTENFDDCHLEEAERRRSRSFGARLILKHILRGSSSKSDDPPVKKGKERDTSEDGGATAQTADHSPPQNVCQDAPSTSGQSVRPDQLSIRHESVSPECRHRLGYLLSPGCPEIRRARDKRNRRRAQQDDNINDSMIEVRFRLGRVRPHMTCLISVQSALERLVSGVADAIRSLSRDDVDEEMRRYLTEKIKKLQAEIGTINDSISQRFNSVRRQFLQDEKAAITVMNETDPDNVEQCRLGIKRLNVSIGVVESHRVELQAIRTSLRPLLQDIQTRLGVIRGQVDEIETNIGSTPLQETRRYLFLMMEDIERIFARLDGQS